jgi:hypothetical protein
MTATFSQIGNSAATRNAKLLELANKGLIEWQDNIAYGFGEALRRLNKDGSWDQRWKSAGLFSELNGLQKINIEAWDPANILGRLDHIHERAFEPIWDIRKAWIDRIRKAAADEIEDLIEQAQKAMKLSSIEWIIALWEDEDAHSYKSEARLMAEAEAEAWNEIRALELKGRLSQPAYLKTFTWIAQQWHNLANEFIDTLNGLEADHSELIAQRKAAEQKAQDAIAELYAMPTGYLSNSQKWKLDFRKRTAEENPEIFKEATLLHSLPNNSTAYALRAMLPGIFQKESDDKMNLLNYFGSQKLITAKDKEAILQDRFNPEGYAQAKPTLWQTFLILLAIRKGQYIISFN